MSDTQQQVIKNIDNTKFIAVQGPPGTGKSQTIVNLVAHLVANGKTVLVASRMDKAVDVVAERLNELGASHMALRAGRLNYQRSLSSELNALIAEHSGLDEDVEDALFADTDDMKTISTYFGIPKTKAKRLSNSKNHGMTNQLKFKKKAHFIRRRFHQKKS